MLTADVRSWNRFRSMDHFLFQKYGTANDWSEKCRDNIEHYTLCFKDSKFDDNN